MIFLLFTGKVLIAPELLAPPITDRPSRSRIRRRDSRQTLGWMESLQPPTPNLFVPHLGPILFLPLI